MYTQMDPNMRVIITMVSLMGWELILGQMAIFIMVNGKMVFEVVLASSNGRMTEQLTLVSSKTIVYTAKVLFIIKMDPTLKVSFKMIKGMGLASFSGLMAHSILDSGKKEKRMGLVE